MTQQPEPLSVDTILAIHAATIERFGGLDGVRDEGLLESAVALLFQSFGGKEMYPTVAQKAEWVESQIG